MTFQFWSAFRALTLAASRMHTRPHDSDTVRTPSPPTRGTRRSCRSSPLEIRAALRSSATSAIEAGRKLIEAKAILHHGEWLPWLREHVRISGRTRTGLHGLGRATKSAACRAFVDPCWRWSRSEPTRRPGQPPAAPAPDNHAAHPHGRAGRVSPASVPRHLQHHQRTHSWAYFSGTP